MPIPRQTGALWGLTRPNQFAKIRKTVVDYELVESNDVVYRFEGNLQPVPAQELRMLREGERNWKFWSLLTKHKELENDDVIADSSGKQYRVLKVEDWSFGDYLLAEQPPQGAPAAPFATGGREPLKVVADVLRVCLGLPADAVVVAYEKNLIPKTNGLYVSIDAVGPDKTIGNVNEVDEDGNEVRSRSYSQLVQIDLLSYDASARRRKGEAAMALASIYAVQQMEKYTMSIARNPSPFVDASTPEPTKRLNRFVSTCVVFAVDRLVVADAPLFVSFPGQVTEGGPLVPFNPLVTPFLAVP